MATAWLASVHGTDAARTVRLDLAGFDAATHYPHGAIASGLPLVLGSGGRYVPWTTGPIVGLLLGDVSVPAYATPPVLAAALLSHGFVDVTALPVAVTAADLPPLIAAV